jgi:hypothetical protein
MPMVGKIDHARAPSRPPCAHGLRRSSLGVMPVSCRKRVAKCCDDGKPSSLAMVEIESSVSARSFRASASFRPRKARLIVTPRSLNTAGSSVQPAQVTLAHGQPMEEFAERGVRVTIGQQNAVDVL